MKKKFSQIISTKSHDTISTHKVFGFDLESFLLDFAQARIHTLANRAQK